MEIECIAQKKNKNCKIISEDCLSCLGELGGELENDLFERFGIFNNCKLGFKRDHLGRCRRVIRS